MELCSPIFMWSMIAMEYDVTVFALSNILYLLLCTCEAMNGIQNIKVY